MIWLLLVAAGWIIALIGSTVKGVAETAEEGATNLSDLLGRKHLVRLPNAPPEFLSLEIKLQNEDKEKSHLQHYSPRLYSPVPLAEAIYSEVLPKLFKRAGLSVSTDVDVDDVHKLLRYEYVPAYELLKVISEKPTPKFPLARPEKPKPIDPPQEWTPWHCPDFSLEIDLPHYKGLWKPLNYFVHKIFSNALLEANSLSYRQSDAKEKSLQRNKDLEFLYREALNKYEEATKYQAKVWSEVQQSDQKRVDNFFTSYAKEKKEVEAFVSSASAKTADGLVARAEQTFRLEKFPPFVPAEFALKFDDESKILILEHQYPDVGAIHWTKWVSLKSGLSKKPANQKEAKEAANLLYPSLSLRIAYELARLDNENIVEAVVVNGWANYIQKSTGQTKRAYCSSLFAIKTQLLGLNLAAVDPLSAFSALKGVVARSLELIPIAPILRLNTEDKRFVDAKDVLSKMAEGENLAAMDWEDFEHLCRELFEKAFAGSGAEVKVTQASRDQGVDAVIFDPDVLRGGKIVVQAKRYTNTVDVSAVRDLYGAIINEGATKGILVTTSHYGPDAYGFAKNKPITLLNGEELLGLLQKYGYSFKIDLAEAKRLNSEADHKWK